MASILITGASKGIGLATALVLARAGHTVYATMRKPDKSPQLANTAAEEKLPIKISTLDVDSDESVSKAIAAIQKESGGIDVLVNNAGVESWATIEDEDLEGFKSVMETNYFGTIRCIKAVLPDMRKRKSGCIINVSSVAGHIACSPMGAYSASKFAVEALSECLAQELKPFNVRVAIVKPGIIDTSMVERIVDFKPKSEYPQTTRMIGLFRESLAKHVPASLIGEKVLDIVESGTWKLRHPVGPDAEPFLAWRASLNDEQWVDWNSATDDTFYEKVESDFGMNARPLKEELATS